VKAGYLRQRALGGAGDDPMARAVGAVGLLADRVGEISMIMKDSGRHEDPDHS
jgi:hypothetical protein